MAASIRWTRTVSSVLALFSLTASCGGPGEESGPDRPRVTAQREPRDVVLITADTLRHDATGFSGSGKVETPLLDRLAAGSAVFTSARAHAVVTLPSHASILSGLYPFDHRIHDNAGFVLADGVETMATTLREEGYATGAFVSALPLDRRYGLHRGFDLYDDEYDGYTNALRGLPERPGKETVARALDWWRSNEGRTRFLWVHLFTPHFPYAPAEPFATRYRDSPYYGDVAMMDAELEPLLEPLLAQEDRPPLVIFTSDHGESLGEHGEETHGTFVYDSTLKIPLVFWSPGLVPRSERVNAVWHVDLLPTTLDLLGLSVPEYLPGRTLFGGSASAAAAGGYFEALSAYFNRGWAPLTGYMEEDRKVIRLPLPELYDLKTDPREQTNLSETEPRALQELLERLPPVGEILTEREQVDSRTLGRLRTLGYAAGNAPADPEALSDPSRDPKNLIELERLLDAAWTARRQGEMEQAAATLRDLLQREPEMPIALVRLGELLTEMGREAETVDLLEQARGRGVEDEAMRRGLALAYLRTGEPGPAWDVLQADMDSRDPETLAALGRILAHSGRPDEARRMFRRALEIDPTYPAVRVDMATLKMMEGRFAEARTELEVALGQDPYHAEGWNALGVIHSRDERLEDAIRAWEKAVEVDPRLPDALYNLAAGHARTGDLPQAISALQRYSTLVDGEERQRALQILQDLRRQAGRS